MQALKAPGRPIRRPRLILWAWTNSGPDSPGPKATARTAVLGPSNDQVGGFAGQQDPCIQHIPPGRVFDSGTRLEVGEISYANIIPAKTATLVPVRLVPDSASLFQDRPVQRDARRSDS
jgi:hypothetical protein